MAIHPPSPFEPTPNDEEQTLSSSDKKGELGGREISSSTQIGEATQGKIQFEEKKASPSSEGDSPHLDLSDERVSAFTFGKKAETVHQSAIEALAIGDKDAPNPATREWLAREVIPKTSDSNPDTVEWNQNVQLLKNFKFLIDSKQIPFPDSINFPQATLDSITKSSSITWTEGFQERRKFLADQVRTFTPIINSSHRQILSDKSDPRRGLVELAEKMKTSEEAKSSGILIKKTSGGCGGAHFCSSEENPKKLLAILKSVNGDVATIDNIKALAHPFMRVGTRPVVNYESSQKEALAYDLSRAFDCEGIVPPTIMAIIDDPEFFHYFKNPKIQEFFQSCPEEIQKEAITALGGMPSSVRLCSLQAAVENPIELNDLMMHWGADGREERKFNQDNFEDTILLTRILGDTDSHSDNFLVTVKEGEYHLVKVDSGFSLPFNNFAALNALTALPNAKEAISERYKNKILNLDPGKIDELASKYNLNKDEINAAKERIQFMKDLVTTHPNLTHREFELRLRLFSGQAYLGMIFTEKRNYSKQEAYDLKSAFALKPYTEQELKNLKAANRARFKAEDSYTAASQVVSGGLIKTAPPWKAREKIEQAQKLIASDELYFTGIFNALQEKEDGGVFSQNETDNIRRMLATVRWELENIKLDIKENEKAIKIPTKQGMDFYRSSLSKAKADLSNNIQKLKGVEKTLVGILNDVIAGIIPAGEASVEKSKTQASKASSSPNISTYTGEVEEDIEAKRALGYEFGLSDETSSEEGSDSETESTKGSSSTEGYESLRAYEDVIESQSSQGSETKGYDTSDEDENR